MPPCIECVSESESEVAQSCPTLRLRGLLPTRLLRRQSTEFFRQEYWSGLPFPSPGDLPDPGIEPGSPALPADALPSEPQGSPVFKCACTCTCLCLCDLCSLPNQENSIPNLENRNDHNCINRSYFFNKNFVLGMFPSDLCFTYPLGQFYETSTTIIFHYI